MPLNVLYSADAIDRDKAAYEAQADRADKIVRVRVQPQILRSDGGYWPWKGVAWSVGCPTAEDAIALRQALEAFFIAVGKHGAAEVMRALTPTTEKV